MDKGKKKKKKDKKDPAEEQKVLKVGGLWIDSSSFPDLDDEKKDSPPHP